MNDLLKTKKQKIWATVSIIWIFLIILLANVDAYYGFKWTLFFCMGILPIALGWGIFFIWKK
jgi:hypothetical protein